MMSGEIMFEKSRVQVQAEIDRDKPELKKPGRFKYAINRMVILMCYRYYRLQIGTVNDNEPVCVERIVLN